MQGLPDRVLSKYAWFSPRFAFEAGPVPDHVNGTPSQDQNVRNRHWFRNSRKLLRTETEHGLRCWDIGVPIPPVLIPILYLKGVSTGDFEEALAALLGKDAGGLSASTVARLKEAWSEEHGRWSRRDLSSKRYIYFWVDGIHVQARLEDAT